jgi:hypothetical protein
MDQGRKREMLRFDKLRDTEFQLQKEDGQFFLVAIRGKEFFDTPLDGDIYQARDTYEKFLVMWAYNNLREVMGNDAVFYRLVKSQLALEKSDPDFIAAVKRRDWAAIEPKLKKLSDEAWAAEEERQ